MIRRVVVVSLRNLLRQPVRTLLILQGVIWGTALAVFPAAVINGSMRSVEEQSGQLGTDRLLLTQEQVDVTQRFDWAIVARLREQLGNRVRNMTGIAVLDSEYPEIPLLATDTSTLEAQHLSLTRGRFFGIDELRTAQPVCVLQHHSAHMLCGDGDPMGRTIQLTPTLNLKVIGVTALRSTGDNVIDEFGYSQDHPLRVLFDEYKEYVGTYEDEQSAALSQDCAVLLPYTLIPDAQPEWIEMRADPRKVVELRKSLQEILAADGYEPVIYINAILPALYGQTISTFLELNRTIFVLCICVGTSIVCVIMVLSVIERQREIAIRRVEGARKWHIALQFVVETGTLCTVGGLLGVPLGILLAIVRCTLEPLGAVNWAFPTMEATIVVIVVSLIGLVGGLLPAWRAMSVDPVEMLRYE